MNEYKKVRLGDVFDLQMGKTPDRNNSQYWNTTDNKWISIADISKSEKFIYETKEFISESAVKESGIKIIPKDTVIMSFKLSIGKTAITTEDCYSNEAIMAFHKKDFYEIDNNYLFHIFSNKDWSEGANKAVKGVTLNKASLSVATIPLPPIETQKQIAATLDKVTKIIVESRKLLEKYDLLIKSRFIEMFGDPVENPKQWNIEKLKSLTSKIGSGATPKGGRESYISEGISLVRSMNVYKGFFEYEGLAHITEAQAKELDNVTLQENDVLLNITGASVARCCILPKDVLPARVNQHVSILRTTEKINPVYLSNLLISDTEQRVLLGIGGAGGATREAITKTELESLDIPVPPLELQQQFATFVQQIDKSKFEMAIYEKLWYNYQIWRKKMGLFCGILDLFSTWAISDKFGLGAGFLYADYAWKKANERELNKMKAGVTQTITNYINENRKLLNDDLIQILNTFINSIANCNKFNANSILSELKNFLMHKCAYHSCIIEILNHSIEAIESIPEDNLDDGVKFQALQKTKNVIDCSDTNQFPILLKDLFCFYDENGIEVENKEELFDKFESLRKEYLV